MSRPSGSSQRPLRLMQPYDDDTSEAASAASLSEKDPPPSLLRRQFRGGGSSTAPLTSSHTPAASSGKWKAETPQRIGAQSKSKSGSFPPLPSFLSRGQRQTTAAEFFSTPSLQAYHGARDPLSSSAQSSPRPAPPPTSSVDRLAALYQQYQTSGENKSERIVGKYPSQRTQEKKSATPPPALPVHTTRSTATAQRRATDSEKPDCGVGTPVSSGCASLAGEETEQTGERQQGPSRTGHPNRLAAAGVAPSRTQHVTAGAAETSSMSAPRPSRPQEGRSTVTLPADLSGSGVSGMMHTAIFIWASLGFFEMRPNESEVTSDADDEDEEGVAAAREGQSVGSSALQEPSDPLDVEGFLFALGDYLRFFCAETATVSRDTLAEHTALMRNGLWRALFNAVFYCVTVLDARRRRSGSLSSKEREVRSGGPEDEYEVVFPSSSADDDEPDEEREAAVRLSWRVPGESEEARAARCARDPLPSMSPLWAGGPPSHFRGREATTEEGEDNAWRLRGQNIGPERRTPLLDLYSGRLRAPLPTADWYFTLRCLTQIGYRRDTFYLQTPFSASPLELLLALLWLTQQYKLLAMAEYVELNRRYGFLLQYHVEDSFWRGSAHGSAGAHTNALVSRRGQTRERMLYHLSNASVWPPVSFEENSAVHLRLVQLERCLGRSAPHESTTTSATLQVRRLMAVQRLISLSFNRLHHALQRQAEQTVLLGLHSPLDAQLCRKEHHDLYEEVMAGLTYVQGTEARLQTAAASLAKAGSLVAFLLRYEDTNVSAEEVLLALEEDDATWLDSDSVYGNDEDGEEADVAQRNRWKPQQSTKTPKRTAAERWRRAVRRGALPPPPPPPASSSLPTSAAALAQSLSTFRATQSRASLTETWKRLLRRSHVAPHTIPPENLRFLLDVEAQRIQEARVRENMRSRYSLQAALAAELAVLGYERQQRRQRSSSHSPLRRDAKLVDESVSSRRTADADTDAEARPVRVALPAMELVTNAAVTFAQLQAEEEAYGPVALSTAELQLTEVGEPAAGSTTSAQLELARLQAWETELDAQLDVQAQTEARVAHCKMTLETLFHQFGLRMATPIVPGKTH